MAPIVIDVPDEREQIGDIISGKLGLRSHHKPPFLRVCYEQICRSENALSAAGAEEWTSRVTSERKLTLSYESAL